MASFSGGGIDNDNTLTLDASTVSGNTAAYSGGGINSVGINSGGILTQSNITVSGNAVYFGGVIRNNGTLTLTKQHRRGQYGGLCRRRHLQRGHHDPGRQHRLRQYVRARRGAASTAAAPEP